MCKEYPRQSCHIITSVSWNLFPATEVYENQGGAEQLNFSCNPFQECDLLITGGLGASLIMGHVLLAFVNHLQNEIHFQYSSNFPSSQKSYFLCWEEMVKSGNMGRRMVD